MVQWDTVKLMLILQWNLGLKSQIIDSTNDFAQLDIPSEEKVFIELASNLKIDGGHFDGVLILNKILYDQSKYKFLWYENMWNVLLDCVFCGDQCGSLPVDVWEYNVCGVCGLLSLLGMFTIKY